jgi:phosphoglycolate phosphatase
MKYKLVIFDFDGTLADTFPFALNVMDQVVDKFGLKKVDPNEIDALRHMDARRVMKHFEIPFWKVPAITNHVMGLLGEQIHLLTLFDGIDQLLKDLSSRGIKIGIVTSNTYENVLKILGPENAALVEYYECGVKLFGKQSKLKKVLKQSGVDAEDALCIGDEIRDIQAAQKVNIPFGAVGWGFTNIEALKEYQPTEVFINVAEIAQKLA